MFLLPPRSLQIQGQEPLQDLFVGDVVGPAVGVEDGVVEFTVGQIAQLPVAAVAWVAQVAVRDLGARILGDVG